MDIDRGFVRLREGLVHYRSIAAEAEARPLLMFHLSPSSSRGLEPLMRALRMAGHGGWLLAPDTLGNGDSDAPEGTKPDIAYFAESMVRFADRLGLEQVDLYGTHTGARIACEVAAAFPDRVGRVILDGITQYDAETRTRYLSDYVPQVVPDAYGQQFVWGFNFVRDQYLFSPYYKRDAEHRIARDVPPPDQLHDATIDIMKALGTYHIPYLAAFDYPSMDRIGQVQAPVMLLKPASAAPVLAEAAEKLARLSRNGVVGRPAAELADYAEICVAFLQGRNHPGLAQPEE